MCEYPISRNCKKLETIPTLGFVAFIYFFSFPVTQTKFVYVTEIATWFIKIL